MKRDETKSEHQTVYLVQVHDERVGYKGVSYLKYDDYFNTYNTTDDKTQATSFIDEERAKAIAHFYQSVAVYRQKDMVYTLLKQVISETEIALEKQDYLNGHRVVSEDDNAHTVETE
ncbi:hypothetical protein KG091_04415 [Carnobacteriaceae bacterium zg-ZUI78]|nr:hypothetical protein [Carnobacteriaceae bacterium zg-ZUI78]